MKQNCVQDFCFSFVSNLGGVVLTILNLALDFVIQILPGRQPAPHHFLKERQEEAEREVKQIYLCCFLASSSGKSVGKGSRTPEPKCNSRESPSMNFKCPHSLCHLLAKKIQCWLFCFIKQPTTSREFLQNCLTNRMEIVTSRRISISPLKSFNIH